MIRINQIFWKLIPVQEILVESFTFWIFVRAWRNVSEFENILLHLLCILWYSWLLRMTSSTIIIEGLHRLLAYKEILNSTQFDDIDWISPPDSYVCYHMCWFTDSPDWNRREFVNLDNSIPNPLLENQAVFTYPVKNNLTVGNFKWIRWKLLRACRTTSPECVLTNAAYNSALGWIIPLGTRRDLANLGWQENLPFFSLNRAYMTMQTSD